jgi:hypothetical protein
VLLLACAPAVTVRTVVPTLPAPWGERYTFVPGRPADPLTASALGAARWDEVLAGAASCVALAEAGGETVDDARVAWCALGAGWAWPVSWWGTELVAWDQPPPGLGAKLAEGGEVGLVRARVGAGDRWVLLVGDRRSDQPALARVQALGATVELPGARASDPEGRVVEGPVQLDQRGEWWLETDAAAFSLWVGVAAPRVPPSWPRPTGAAERDVEAALAALRRWYGRGELTRDSMIDSVARAVLASQRDGVRALAAAGFADVRAGGGPCSGRDGVACVAAVWRTVPGHALGCGELATWGMAWKPEGAGVRMQILAAGEP